MAIPAPCWPTRATTAMRSAMTCATAAQHPRSRAGATARYSTLSANPSMRCGHGLSASLGISESDSNRSGNATTLISWEKPVPSWRSGGGQTAGHQLNAGNIEPGHGTLDSCLHVFGQAPVAVQPGESALNHPAAGQQNKALGDVRPFDDLDRPITEIFEGILQLFTGVTSVGEHVAQPGK